MGAGTGARLFLVGGGGLLRKHSIAQQGQYKGQKNDVEATLRTHWIQFSAIPSSPGQNNSFTKWVPASDICWTRASVQ